MDNHKLESIEETLAGINARLDNLSVERAINVTPQGKNRSAITKDRRTEDILRTTQHELSTTKHDLVTNARGLSNLRAFTSGVLSDQVDQDIKVQMRVARAMGHLERFDKHVNKTPSKGLSKNIERIILIVVIAVIICFVIVGVVQPQVLNPIEGWLSPGPTQLCLSQAQNAGYGISNSTLAQLKVNSANDGCYSQATTLGYEHQGLAVFLPVVLIVLGLFFYRRWHRR